MKATVTKTLILDGPNAGTWKYRIVLRAEGQYHVSLEHESIDTEKIAVEQMRRNMTEAIYGGVLRDYQAIGEHLYGIVQLATSPSVVHLLTEVLREIKASTIKLTECIEVDEVIETTPRKDG